MNDKSDKINKLVQGAHLSGASEVVIVSAKDILAEDHLADYCRKPRCENYGLSKSCPPHVPGPLAFRKQLEAFDQGLFFKIDVPSELLFSSERREFFQLLHEIAANIEQSAIKMGFTRAQAYAGGSCKNIFCFDFLDCPGLLDPGNCRNPQRARPSMSGFGINVAKLVKTAGWTGTHGPDSIGGVSPGGVLPGGVSPGSAGSDAAPGEAENLIPAPISPIYGLVLIN